MGRPRKPIEGWNDDEIDQWLRRFRGTPTECVAHCMPHLRGAVRKRALERVRAWSEKMQAEGLDFSVSKAPPRNGNLRVLPQPKARPKPAPEAESGASASTAPPPPASRFAPPSPESIEDVASKSRLDILQWTINQAAAKAVTMPTDKSATSYLKLVADLHSELDQLRSTATDDHISLDQLCEILPRFVSHLPNKVLDMMMEEILRRNPKWTVTVKSRVTA